MDCMINNMETSMEKYIAKCLRFKKLTIWSNLVKLEDVDELFAGTDPEHGNMIHAAVQSFFDKIAQFKKEFPKAPTNSADRGRT